jgi:hypothetical protein
VRAALVALALAACVHDNYRCANDADCDLHAAGRCEVDGRCTFYDPSCDSTRRYEPHSEALSGTCFDDAATPADLCAGGQPPARPDTECTAAVCTALPACCATGWFDACVQIAEQRCELTCDTDLQLAATSGGDTEAFALRWDRATSTWIGAPAANVTAVAWVGDEPVAIEDDQLVFGGGAIALDPSHRVRGAAPVDLDRDGRPTIALDVTFSAMQAIDIVKLDTGDVRTIPTGAAFRASWGDLDRDGFPDAVAADGSSTRYAFLGAITDEAATAESLDGAASGNTTGANPKNPAEYPTSTALPPAVRSLDWLDADGDGALDLVAIGNSVRLHTGADRIPDTAITSIDCDPPQTGACADPVANTQPAFAGAAFPDVANGPALVLATFPARGLHVMRLAPPAADRVFTYGFPEDGAPILAVIVRDLDGDHVLDVTAIDAHLHVFTSLGTADLIESTPITPSTQNPFVTIDVAISGTPH